MKRRLGTTRFEVLAYTTGMVGALLTARGADYNIVFELGSLVVALGFLAAINGAYLSLFDRSQSSL